VYQDCFIIALAPMQLQTFRTYSDSYHLQLVTFIQHSTTVTQTHYSNPTDQQPKRIFFLPSLRSGLFTGLPVRPFRQDCLTWCAVVNGVFTWFAVVDAMWCAVVDVKSGMNGVRCGAWYICTVRCGA
jgi:hypothetical protein